MSLGGVFDFSKLEKRLEETQTIIDDPDGWKDPARVKSATAENRQISHLITSLDDYSSRIDIADEMYLLLAEEPDAETQKMVDDIRIPSGTVSRGR